MARPTVSVDRAYVDAVAIAGGVPILLPPVDPDVVSDLVDGIDGLVLSGGGDVDPARYGAERAPETGGVDPARDASELALVPCAEDRGIPLLAVCRGMQVLNVAHGGTLLQHVPHVTHTEHLDVAHWDVAANPVTVEEGSRLHELCGERHLSVNSLHHQAVDRVGSGLRVTAHDEDGIVEALESTTDDAVLGVQWHPELLIDEPEHEALFVWLVNHASARISGAEAGRRER
jgi:putative glutamine amidotransferase